MTYKRRAKFKGFRVLLSRLLTANLGLQEALSGFRGAPAGLPRAPSGLRRSPSGLLGHLQGIGAPSGIQMKTPSRPGNKDNKAPLYGHHKETVNSVNKVRSIV